jgi:predicted TIM-barrel fold metal-dependent hydrolase
MALIDGYSHIYPENYLGKYAKHSPMISKMASELKYLADVEGRIRFMDQLGIDREIISLAMPNLDDLNLPVKDTNEATQISNDGICELAENHQSRFVPIGTVSLQDPEFAVAESRRCLNELGMKGIQIVSNVKGQHLGSPQFEPFFNYMEQSGKPVWLHPTFMRNTYGWLREDAVDIMVGWDFDVTLALIKMMSSGLIRRNPKLKIIVHHLGSLLPILAGRIISFLNPMDPNPETPLNWMKSLYVDTAEGMWMPWLKDGIEFFGLDHVLFGTDFPWGNSSNIISNIRSLDIPESKREKLFSGNISKLLGL